MTGVAECPTVIFHDHDTTFIRVYPMLGDESLGGVTEWVKFAVRVVESTFAYRLVRPWFWSASDIACSDLCYFSIKIKEPAEAFKDMTRRQFEQSYLALQIARKATYRRAHTTEERATYKSSKIPLTEAEHTAGVAKAETAMEALWADTTLLAYLLRVDLLSTLDYIEEQDYHRFPDAYAVLKERGLRL